MKKFKLDKLEQYIGKGVLFILELAIVFILFVLCLHIINWLVNTMLNNFWFAITFAFLDVILILKELKEI